MNAGTPQLIGPRHLQLLARRWPLSGRAILNDAQWRLNAMLNHGDRNQTFECGDTAVGDSAIFCGQISRKSAPKWRGPAIILDIDETGVTVKFRSQTFKIARYRVRKRAGSPPRTQIGTRDMKAKDAPARERRGGAASGGGFRYTGTPQDMERNEWYG